MFPKSNPVANPLFTFRWEILVICGIKHRLIEGEGIGLDPDGFSSSLDLMKTVGAFCFLGEPSGDPIGDPEELYLQKGQRRCTNLPSMWCKPMVGSGRLLVSNSTSIDNFLGIMIYNFIGHYISTIFSKSSPLASPLFTFRWEILVICGIKHRLIESE